MNQAGANVTIIGAGAAGLGAAYYLNQNKRQFNILEASNRIGGRVQTVNFGAEKECIVELGANFIHGSVVSNPLYTLAIQENLIDHKTLRVVDLRTGHAYTSDGRIIDKDLGIKVWNVFMLIAAEAKRETGFKGSLKEYFDSRLDDALAEFGSEDRHDAALIYNSTMASYLSFHVGDDLAKIGLDSHGAYRELPGGDCVLPKGYANLLDALTRHFPPNSIKFGRRVVHVDWGGDPIKIKCSDGSEFRTRHVIVTLPLGCLKKYHKSLFSPPLPSDKSDAIEKLGFGRVDKVFLQFERPFWGSDFGAIRFAFDDTKDRTDWTKFIFGFEPVVDNPNVLVGWLSGDGAEIMEGLSDERIRHDCVRILRSFTGNPLIPTPCRIRVSKWCTNPLSYGSYTYLPVGCDRKYLSDLSKPTSDSKPKLLFAGEATHNEYFSTVHGALLSGIAAARLILETETFESET